MTAREKHEQSANETSVCAHNAVGAAGSLLAITPACLHVADRGVVATACRQEGWRACDECDGARASLGQVAGLRGNANYTGPIIEIYERAIPYNVTMLFAA